MEEIPLVDSLFVATTLAIHSNTPNRPSPRISKKCYGPLVPPLGSFEWRHSHCCGRIKFLHQLRKIW